MKILIACEFSGVVRSAFAERGHDVMSCDLLPTEKPGQHYKGDVFDIIHDGWDMISARVNQCIYILCMYVSRMDEHFKILKDFPAYRISNHGRIQSRWERGSYYNGFECEDKWIDLKTHPDTKGYHQVHLCDGRGTIKTIRVHKIMAQCFLSTPTIDKPIVRHLDSNPSNNDISNLAYGTYTENENDKILNGTWNTRNGGAKLTPTQVVEIRNKLTCGETQKTLAIEYGVSRPTITRISNNQIWSQIK